LGHNQTGIPLMKNVRFISRILHVVCKGLAVLYLATALYMAIVFLLSRGPEGTGLLQLTAPNGFTIMFPFTRTPFLLGENTNWFKAMMLVATAAYGTFAWLLGDVFWVFKQEKLFTRTGVRKLTIFYLANLTVPGLILVIALFFTSDVKDLVNLTILHGIIGIFAYFMASIFNQGVALQDEQDYTL
jgi:hypothetical protein